MAQEWEKANPGPHDPACFAVRVLPLLDSATLPEMMKATGLSSAYCWRIRRRDGIPHPMDWEALAGLADQLLAE